MPGIEQRTQRERGDLLPGKSAGLQPRLGEAERGRRAHRDDFDLAAALAAQYPGAPARGATAQVQSIVVAVPLIPVRGLEGAYSPDPTTFGAPGVYPGYTLLRQGSGQLGTRLDTIRRVIIKLHSQVLM